MTYISDTQFYNPLYDGYDINPQANKEMDKDAFLQLMVTQLRFQNPLEPMQDQEFVSQLAQFSQLEQLENMSESLDTNTQVDYIMSQTIANTMATALIGKTVIAGGSDFDLVAGRDTDISFNLEGNASDVKINIYDEGGSLVKVINLEDIDKGDHTISWDGHGTNGTQLGSGTYSYEIHATNAAGDEIKANKRVIGIVDSVRYEDGQAFLIVDGYKVDLASIIEIDDSGSLSTHVDN